MSTILTYVVNWFGLAIIAILNGAAREKVYGPHVTQIKAAQLSTIIGLCLFSLYIWFLTGIVPITSGHLALLIGGIWLVMTMAFELVFGHLLAGRSWKYLTQEHDLFAGRLWGLVLLWTWALRFL